MEAQLEKIRMEANKAMVKKVKMAVKKAQSTKVKNAVNIQDNGKKTLAKKGKKIATKKRGKLNEMLDIDTGQEDESHTQPSD